ncbi:hypothetical protein BDB00DRAFT_793693 [Zychaea mexicana]|uniref:uncharacterized protein n=1 Tax=Zychaea mexicana TaxID=64656 RepID=UPI0022FDB154|nr:uncharacterized protein BDB00DRAFT_793693 [Zychaea mexicana]KAI9469323.1 hypothetical protein BDB00DRAFT_793693 [Zychaea mexicana]
MAPSSGDFPPVTTSSGESRRGSLCVSNDAPPAKVCGTSLGPRRNSGRRDGSFLELLSSPLDSSPMVDDSQGSMQDCPRRRDSDGSGAVLAGGALVSSATANGDPSSSSSQSSASHPADFSIRSLPMNKSALEAQRVASIRRRFAGRGYSPAPLEAICAPLLSRSSTNLSYLGGQLRFVMWASRVGVDINSFSAVDLVNILSLAHQQGYSANTILLFKTAVLVFHCNPGSIRKDLGLKRLLDRIKVTAPPRPLTHPSFDITPTLIHLSQLTSTASTPLIKLNQKTAFLLGTAAFLRPSDLHRIDLTMLKTDCICAL